LVDTFPPFLKVTIMWLGCWTACGWKPWLLKWQLKFGHHLSTFFKIHYSGIRVLNYLQPKILVIQVVIEIWLTPFHFYFIFNHCIATRVLKCLWSKPLVARVVTKIWLTFFHLFLI
jgi:hypothetical protein